MDSVTENSDRRAFATERLGDRLDGIAELCGRHGIVQLHVFGSLLTSAFSPSSDVDLIATFAKGSVPTLFEHMRIEEEFTSLLRRQVDLLTRGAIDASSNTLLRDEIRRSEVLLYAR